MYGVLHHLARRGFEATQDNYNNGFEIKSVEDQPDEQIRRFPIWGIAIIWSTFMLFLFVQFAIRYTLGSIVATLTAIETPSATAFTVDPPAPSHDSDVPLLSADQKVDETEPELFLIKSKPITSKIRTTIKHLRAQAGPWSRFRGLQVAIVYHLIYAFFYNLVVGRFASPLGRSLFAIAAHTALARLHMTWTHVVVSNPSPKTWWRRIPSTKSAAKILLPTAIWATADQLAIYIPVALAYVYGLNRHVEDPSYYKTAPPKELLGLWAQLLGCALVALFIVFAIVFPAEVTLTRVQASMLPEEDEAIVPFDRTFGGRVQPAITGGSGCVSMLDAWKTFDWAARFRLVKLYVKIFAIQVTTTLLFIGVIVGELRLILGDDLHKVVKMAHQGLKL